MLLLMKSTAVVGSSNLCSVPLGSVIHCTQHYREYKPKLHSFERAEKAFCIPNLCSFLNQWMSCRSPAKDLVRWDPSRPSGILIKQILFLFDQPSISSHLTFRWSTCVLQVFLAQSRGHFDLMLYAPTPGWCYCRLRLSVVEVLLNFSAWIAQWQSHAPAQMKENWSYCKCHPWGNASSPEGVEH